METFRLKSYANRMFSQHKHNGHFMFYILKKKQSFLLFIKLYCAVPTFYMLLRYKRFFFVQLIY